jgi:Ca2+-binding RTX toxin-like protein
MLKVLSFSKRKIKTFAQTISAIISVLVIIALTAMAGFVSEWAATLIGTSGPDTLAGTDNDDKIFGRGGNDRISDGLRSDLISAGSGDDTMELDGVGGIPTMQVVRM